MTNEKVIRQYRQQIKRQQQLIKEIEDRIEILASSSAIPSQKTLFFIDR